MTVVSRSQWGSRKARYRNTGNLNERSTIHWNGPKVPVTSHDKCAGLIRGIQNYHMDGRGWSDIAYNFVVCQHGVIFEGRGLNVRNAGQGTNRGNAVSHAIMCLSGEGNSFPAKQKAGVRECVRYIADHTDAPDAAMPHSDWHSTACPGDERRDWIRKGMPVKGGSPPSKPSKPSGRPVLKRGSRGDAVVVLQTILRNKAGGGITVDGVFGPSTERKVKLLQRMFHLTQDGIVGEATWKVLDFINAR